MLIFQKTELVLTITLVLFNLLSLVQAQPLDIDQSTREINRPLSEQRVKELQPGPTPLPDIETKKEKKPMGGLSFFIKKIQLVGVESFSPDEFDFIKEKYENREVSLEELNILTNEIEKEYFKRGIIATCFVEPQKVKDNILIIQVVEAKMGKLYIKDHKYFKKDRLTYYWKVKNGKVIKYSEILRSLYLINKNPDRKAKITLHEGKTPQTTDVTLDVSTKFPVHLIYNFDNEGVTSTGKTRMTLGGKHHNFLGIDDTLLTGYIWGNSFSSIYTYHSVPITNFGTSIVYGHSYSKASPKKEFGSSGVHSIARNSIFSLDQDIFKEGKYVGDVHLGFDAEDKTITQNSGTTNRDRLRIIRLGSNWIFQELKRITYLTTEISEGINGFGAREKNPLSSREAENTFAKFDLGLQHKESLTKNIQGSIQIKGQVTSNRLSPQEGFYLGGINSVRGYPSGDFLADDAIQTNLEISISASSIPEWFQMPFLERYFRDNVTMVGFFDHGWGNKHNHLSTEKPTANLRGAGAGFRIHLFNKALLRLEWGFPIGDKTITESGKSRFHFAVEFES